MSQLKRSVKTQLRACLAAVRAYNDQLNDPHGDGTGAGAKAPDGDDYNAILAIIEPLYEAVNR